MSKMNKEVVEGLKGMDGVKSRREMAEMRSNLVSGLFLLLIVGAANVLLWWSPVESTLRVVISGKLTLIALLKIAGIGFFGLVLRSVSATMADHNKYFRREIDLRRKFYRGEVNGGQVVDYSDPSGKGVSPQPGMSFMLDLAGKIAFALLSLVGVIIVIFKWGILDPLTINDVDYAKHVVIAGMFCVVVLVSIFSKLTNRFSEYRGYSQDNRGTYRNLRENGGSYGYDPDQGLVVTVNQPSPTPQATPRVADGNGSAGKNESTKEPEFTDWRIAKLYEALK